jgi:ribose transport system substrate-binding protein
MTKLTFLLSLPTDDNDYQQEQAVAANEAAKQQGVSLQITYADNDAIKQSDQILQAVQSDQEKRPNAILFEPLGSTSLPQAARAASGRGIGWVILNRNAEYLAELRRTGRAPVFSVSSDHLGIGRIQGLQFAALLPQGGSVLYIQGPSENSAAKERTLGMQETKPANIKINMLKGQWTEESAYKAVSSWMRLSTSGVQLVDLVGAQDDSMAMGARRAMTEQPNEALRKRWLAVPFTGCDGLLNTGQKYVRDGQLTATVVVPPNTKLALEMLVSAMRDGKTPPEQVLTVPASFPSIEELIR